MSKGATKVQYNKGTIQQRYNTTNKHNQRKNNTLEVIQVYKYLKSCVDYKLWEVIVSGIIS